MVNKVIDYINKSPDPWGLLKIGIDKNRAKIIKNGINKIGLVLDLGCGFGIYSNLLKKLGNTVISMDISKRMIKDGKVNKKLNFCINDNYNIPVKDKTFDAVLCMGTLIYVDNKKEFLKEVNRVLMPNGILCIIDRNKFSLFNLLINKLRHTEKAVDNINNFLTLNKIKSILKETSFVIEKIQGDRIDIPLLSRINFLNKLFILLGSAFPSMSYFIIIKSRAIK